MAAEREMCGSEESIAQRSQRSQRGIWVGGFAFCEHRGFWREMCEIGESIAQRSRRSQRGIWVGDPLFVNTRGF